MYDRNVKGKTLHFEASGALLDASLVMRDRETDSWWSIMTSDAIGGSLKQTRLVEQPWGTKVQWRDWKKAHPSTQVLSVNGQEHIENNPYDNYFASEDTFRNHTVSDSRLAPKAAIYSFHHQGQPYAVPHSRFEGKGRVFLLEDKSGNAVLLHRPRGASFYASSTALLVPAQLAGTPAKELLERHSRGEIELDPIGGFDTYWYTWIAVNKNSLLLR